MNKRIVLLCMMFLLVLPFAYSATNVNVAGQSKGGKAIASAEHATGPAVGANAEDGSTSWWDSGRSVPDFINISFSKENYIKNITVDVRSGNNWVGSAINISCWDSTNSKWVMKHQDVGVSGTYVRYFNDTDCTTTAIRLHAYTGSPNLIINEIYAYNGTPATPPPTPEGTYNFTFTANDLYDSGAINNFAVRLRRGATSYYITSSAGTAHITNGTIPMGNWNLTYNATFNTSNYFNRTYEINLTKAGSQAGGIYQAILYINASEIITGKKINVFNASVGTVFNESNSTGWTKFYLKAGTYTIQANASHYMNRSSRITISSLQTAISTIKLFNGILKINASSRIDGGDIDIFSTYLYGTNITYTNLSSTTNGNIYIPLITGKYMINFSEELGNFSIDNQSLNLLLDNFFPNITFRPYTHNSINISIFDEILGRGNTIFRGKTVYLELSSSINSYNYSTNTSSIYVDLLSPLEYRIHYYSEQYEKRDYYFTVNNMTHDSLELYLLSDGNSTDVTISTVDESGIDLYDATIYLKRYYVDTNSYRTVAMSKTNQEGEAVINVDFNDAFYQILAVYDGFSTQTVGAKIFSLTPTIKIETTTNPFDSIDIVDNVITDLTFNNATSTFTYTFTSLSGAVTGVLEVKKITPLTEETVCTASDTTTSGSLLCTITPTTDSEEFVAYGTIESGGSYIREILSFNQWRDTSRAVFGNTGVYLSLLMAGTFAGLGAFSPVMSLVMFLVGMLGVAFMGISTISWIVYFGIFILGSVLIYKLKQ